VRLPPGRETGDQAPLDRSPPTAKTIGSSIPAPLAHNGGRVAAACKITSPCGRRGRLPMPAGRHSVRRPAVIRIVTFFPLPHSRFLSSPADPPRKAPPARERGAEKPITGIASAARACACAGRHSQPQRGSVSRRSHSDSSRTSDPGAQRSIILVSGCFEGGRRRRRISHAGVVDVATPRIGGRSGNRKSWPGVTWVRGRFPRSSSVAAVRAGPYTMPAGNQARRGRRRAAAAERAIPWAVKATRLGVVAEAAAVSRRKQNGGGPI